MQKFCIVLLFSLPALAGAQWEPEVKLSTNEVSAALNENMGQCIVADGNALHAVWCDTNNNGSAIYYKRSLDGGSAWGPDTRISGTPGHDSFPLLAFSSATLHLVFMRNDGTSPTASYYKRSTDGGQTWGPDVYLGDTKWWPGVAASGSMVYVSLNTRLPDGNSEVYFRRSTDGGTTWEATQRISNAPGRSEDPGIMASGPYVHLVWNDNRATSTGGGMAVYTRRSLDWGATWDPETALTKAPAYTYFPMVYLNGSHVDIAFGDRRTGIYDIYYLHSPDYGTNWGPAQQITATPTQDFYPAVARDGQNVHLAWTTGLAGSGEIIYQHSGDGGATWDPPANLVSQGSNPFIAVAGEALHVIFISQRDGHPAIYYKRNLTGNKTPAPWAIPARQWSLY